MRVPVGVVGVAVGGGDVGMCVGSEGARVGVPGWAVGLEVGVAGSSASEPQAMSAMLIATSTAEANTAREIRRENKDLNPGEELVPFHRTRPGSKPA